MIRFSKNCLTTVKQGLTTTFLLYPKMTIQNNLAENINSVLQSIIRLKGPKTIITVEERLRTTVIVRNEPQILNELQFKRNYHGIFLLNNMKKKNYERMIKNEWIFPSVQKTEVYA